MLQSGRPKDRAGCRANQAGLAFQDQTARNHGRFMRDGTTLADRLADAVIVLVRAKQRASGALFIVGGKATVADRGAVVEEIERAVQRLPFKVCAR